MTRINNRGTSLIVVLALIAGLSVLVAAWAEYTRINLRQGRLLRARTEAVAAAEGGLATARALLSAHRDAMLAAEPPGSATPVLALDLWRNGLVLSPPLVESVPQPPGAMSLFVVYRQDEEHFRIEALGVVRELSGQETLGEMVGIVKISRDGLNLIWKQEV